MVIQGIIDVFFKEFVFGFMYNDIERAIEDAKANFLVALGLSAYTEVIGGLVSGDLGRSGKSRSNYEAFLPYLGSYYVNLHNKIDLYKRIRCGLVHEYKVKGKAMIAVNFSDESVPGIVYTEKLDHITFAVAHYFRDFKIGVNNYYDLLKSEDEKAVEKFRNAYNRI